jgi:hypothetical protein
MPFCKCYRTAPPSGLIPLLTLPDATATASIAMLRCVWTQCLCLRSPRLLPGYEVDERSNLFLLPLKSAESLLIRWQRTRQTKQNDKPGSIRRLTHSCSMRMRICHFLRSALFRLRDGRKGAFLSRGIVRERGQGSDIAVVS